MCERVCFYYVWHSAHGKATAFVCGPVIIMTIIMLEYEMAARVRRFGALEARVGLVSVCVCALNVRIGITTTIIISDCLFVPRYDLQNVFAVAAVLVAFRAHALFACALAAAASSSSSSRVFICPMQNGPAAGAAPQIPFGSREHDLLQASISRTKANPRRDDCIISRRCTFRVNTRKKKW